MTRILAVALLVLTLAACSKVTQDNFAKVQNGMSEADVVAILGKPTETSSINVLGLEGTSSKWVSGDAVISIQFAGGKVRLKSFDKAGAPPPPR